MSDGPNLLELHVSRKLLNENGPAERFPPENTFDPRGCSTRRGVAESIESVFIVKDMQSNMGNVDEWTVRLDMEEHRSTTPRRFGCAAAHYRTAKRALVSPWLLLAAASCAAPRPPLIVTDPDPSVKIPAIQKAVRENDRSAVPQLIKDLASDDPAVRLYANRALEQLTGKSFGYRYFADEDQRDAAVKKWRQWFDDQADAGPKETTAPANAATGP
jgi:hypothetical protein